MGLVSAIPDARGQEHPGAFGTRIKYLLESKPFRASRPPKCSVSTVPNPSFYMLIRVRERERDPLQFSHILFAASPVEPEAETPRV